MIVICPSETLFLAHELVSKVPKKLTWSQKRRLKKGKSVKIGRPSDAFYHLYNNFMFKTCPVHGISVHVRIEATKNIKKCLKCFFAALT